MLLKEKATVGKPIRVETNIFPISAMKAVMAYQYDVKMDPEIGYLRNAVFQQFQSAIQKEHPKAWFVYDGRSLAFSTFLIKPTELQVTVPREDAVFPQSKPKKGQSEFNLEWKAAKINAQVNNPAHACITISIKKVADINMKKLLDACAGGVIDEQTRAAENCLSVVLKYIPSILYVSVGNSFFSPETAVSIRGGLEIWKGYHQSVKELMAGHLGINIGIAATVFRKGGVSVLDYLVDVCEVNDVRQLERIPSSVLESHLKGVNCVTTHRGDQKQRFRIATLSNQNAETFTFLKDSEKVSVAEYFDSEYGIKLRMPNLPLALKANKTTAFPLEFLSIIPAQRFTKTLVGEQSSDMIKACLRKPDMYRNTVKQAVKQNLKYAENPFLKSFGVEISSEIMNIPARILPPPKVQFGNQSIGPREGQWQMKGVKFISQVPLKSCGFVFFCRISQDQASAISTELLSKFKKMGMSVNVNSCPYIVANPKPSVANPMKTVFLQAQKTFKMKCQILFVVLDDRIKGLYEQVKRVAVCEANVMTQCMLSKHVHDPTRIKDTYVQNLAMKANLKLGGSTNHTDSPIIGNEPTMYLGADVTHPMAGSQAPSIAAIVASYDKGGSKYNTYVRAQPSRVEMIQSMHAVTTKALKDFFNSNKAYPTRVIYYRDGVSDDEFEKLRELEITSIKKAFAELKLKNVKLTVVVVRKRHHIRLFPVDNNKDRSGNCMPGTVIDTDIVRPADFNFILQSHAGIQGMSRPCMYFVVHDENNFTSDQMQKLTNDLCYLCERASRAISMPAPSYRAHHAAAYARMFLQIDSRGAVVLRDVASGIENTQYYM